MSRSAEEKPGANRCLPVRPDDGRALRSAFARTLARRSPAWLCRGSRGAALEPLARSELVGVLAYADARGRDAFAFEPIDSPTSRWRGLWVRTPYSRTVVAELQAVPGQVGRRREGVAGAVQVREGAQGTWPRSKRRPAETSPRRGEKDEPNERLRQSTGRALGAPRKDVDNATRFPPTPAATGHHRDDGAPRRGRLRGSRRRAGPTRASWAATSRRRNRRWLAGLGKLAQARRTTSWLRLALRGGPRARSI